MYGINKISIGIQSTTHSAIATINSVPRTNLNKYSEDFTNAWYNGNAADLGTASLEGPVSPTETTTTNKIIKDEGTDVWRGHLTKQPSLATTTTYTISVYVKQGDGISAGVKVYYSSGVDIDAKIVFSSETMNNREATGNWDDNGFMSVGDGWYRVWGTFTTSGSVADQAIGMVIDGGTTLNKFNYFTGLQIVAGTSMGGYQITTSTAIT